MSNRKVAENRVNIGSFYFLILTLSQSLTNSHSTPFSPYDVDWLKSECDVSIA